MKTRHLAVLVAAILLYQTSTALMGCDDEPRLTELVSKSTIIAVVRINTIVWDRSRIPDFENVAGTSDPTDGLNGGPIIAEATVEEVLKGSAAKSFRFRALHNLPELNGCAHPYFTRN